MTVSSEANYIEYNGDGVTTTFPIPFYFILNSDISAQIADADGNITDLTYGVDYSVSGAGSSSGGSATMNTAYASGYKILFYREPPATQETAYYENGKFPAKSHEKALDKLTMLIQSCFTGLGLALRKPSILANYYDALGNKIRNLQDPSDAQDAATKSYVDVNVEGSKDYSDSLFIRTLRVPEDSINILPYAAERRGMVHTYDAATGQPLLIPAGQLSIGDILNLFSADGLKYIGQCGNMSELRSLPFLALGQQVFLKEHTAGQKMGGGIWYCHSLTNDSGYVDDNGCQIITNAGQVLRRKDVHNLYSDMFGLGPGGDFDSVIQNMFKASRTFNIEEAWITHAGRANPKYRSLGGNVFDLSDGMSFYIRCVGLGRFGATIVHAGNSKCIRFIRNRLTGLEFWVSGGVEGLRIVGQGDSFTGTNNYSGATAIEVSDLWGATLKSIFISGYTGNTGGAAISLYNDTGWTEGTIMEDIVVRQSVNGLWMHRNTAAGNTATDSFFKTQANLDINAGVSGTGINFIRLGDGTSAGKCLLYGHEIKLTGWMSNGSWHNGILVTDYSSCINGLIHFNFDGYGLSSSATSEVLHLIRLGGTNAIFDCDVKNTSGQSDGYGLSMLTLIMNTCLYLDDPNVFNGTVSRGRPLVRAKGMCIKFSGTFTQAECIAGATYSLSALLPGTKFRIRLTSRQENSQYQLLTQEWEVHVRGTDYPCIVRPILNAANLSSTSAQAVTVVSPETKSSFLTSVTLNAAQTQQNSLFGTSLTLTNGQANNAVGYSANSGRKINFVLPADSDATQDMPYFVELEMM
ncbi:hypothetical protein [Klebsiella oxytoca]|uniref:hypothetical protein n=1 Tax=Klebsiella oxytoca TaxID=571 RepID=UPI001156E82C|nr:hypothetical protein [Klebsiella oxytoca]